MPVRTCISCRNKFEKDMLIRIVAKDGKAFLDRNQKQNARGVYICNKKECIEKLLNTKDISKRLKLNVEIESFKELLKNLGE